MKVDELRSILTGYDQDTTRKLVVEMYKLIPKKIREEYEFDELINSIGTSDTVRKPKADREVISDFAVLRRQAETFVEYASLGYYIAPNRIVSKSDRSKWRVPARKLIKSLIAVKGENADEASQLLVEMYRMLSHACSYYIFSTETPFSAVGFSQQELLDIIFAKLFSNGFAQETIRLAVYVVLESHVDRETLHSQLIMTLLKHLTTVDTRQAALEECDYFMRNFKDPAVCPYKSNRFLLSYSNKNWNIDHTDQVIKDCSELYLRISIALHEYDRGVQYFEKHFISRDREMSLYCLLSIMYLYTDDNPRLCELWLKVYDNAVAKGVTPRQILKKWREEVLSLP